MAQYVAKQWIAVELSKVFPYFCDPRNFSSIMPPETAIRIETLDVVPPPGTDAALAQAAGKGTRIEFSFRVVPLLPFRMNWLAEIVEFVPYQLFRDVQVRGPLQRWEHAHGFRSEVRASREGTLITDHIRYSFGRAPLGALLDESILQLALARTFTHRRRVIMQLLEGGSAVTS